nr:pilus assembly PilX N-terminal domain-containing protein [Halomonas chromatireducens]
MTSSLIVGLSTMQGSLIKERLAGNYRSAAQAQMAAESAAVELTNYLQQLQTTPGNVTSVLANLPFHDGLQVPQANWSACRGEFGWEDDSVSPLNLALGRHGCSPAGMRTTAMLPVFLLKGRPAT